MSRPVQFMSFSGGQGVTTLAAAWLLQQPVGRSLVVECATRQEFDDLAACLGVGVSPSDVDYRTIDLPNGSVFVYCAWAPVDYVPSPDVFIGRPTRIDATTVAVVTNRYVPLRAITSSPFVNDVDVVACVVDSQRSLRFDDMARALVGKRCVPITYSYAVDRVVDAGLLTARLPLQLRDELRALTNVIEEFS